MEITGQTLPPNTEWCTIEYLAEYCFNSNGCTFTLNTS